MEPAGLRVSVYLETDTLETHTLETDTLETDTLETDTLETDTRRPTAGLLGFAALNPTYAPVNPPAATTLL